ncbi:MAG: penicillin acylase family protein, partial [Myxococcales bacterium]|nr:penicillin acylase family protein [Myxococcales bacterium]
EVDELREGGELPRALLQQVRLGERVVPEALRWLSPLPRAMASNNWVVAPGRTASGHALLANDPHLETNRLPNVWCEQAFVITGPPAIEVVCATVPGLPAPVVGRSRDLAWGATYAFMDAVDSWVEHCRDGRYRRGDAWEEFTVRRERILRKGKEPVQVTFYENLHGVLDGDPHQEGHYLSTRWSSAESGARSLMASAGMWTARTVAEGQALLGTIETAWSWVLADREGTIGLQMSGLMPRRAPGVSGLVPRPGWDPAFDWQGFVPPEQLPRALDPEAGYLVTANQDLNDLGVARPSNMPMGDYRARRIEALLEGTPAATVEDMQRIQLDVWSQQAADFMEVLRPLLPDTERARRLAAWDLRYTAQSREATLFEAFYRELQLEVFGRGGVGEAVIGHLLDDTGIFIDFYRNFDRVLLAPTSAWHAGRTRDEVFARSFERVAGSEPEPWGERNRIELTNIFFAGRLPRWLGFDRGPVAVLGGRATPRQGQVYRSAGRTTSFVPSLRLVADLGATGLLTALAGGPSDRRWSRWYASDLEGWIRERYKRVEP